VAIAGKHCEVLTQSGGTQASARRERLGQSCEILPWSDQRFGEIERNSGRAGTAGHPESERGPFVTADAMHCQKQTVKKIIEGEADYVLQVKNNSAHTDEDDRGDYRRTRGHWIRGEKRSATHNNGTQSGSCGNSNMHGVSGSGDVAEQVDGPENDRAD
jgi:transposase, IS4 family